MNPQETQQLATHDEKWVPSIERVKISSTNIRLETTVPQKEETFQVIIDIVRIPRASRLSPYLQMSQKSLCSNSDLAYQIDHKKEKRSRRVNIPYPPFTKIIINHFLNLHKSLTNLNHKHYHTIKDDGIVSRLKFVRIGEDYQEYGHLIPDVMLTDAIKHSESYQMFIKYSTHQIPPKKSRGKGSKGKKTIEDSQETIDVSEEFEPESEPSKKKIARRRYVSQTKAKEAKATRKIYATHARIVIESVSESTKKKSSSRSSKSVVIQDTPSTPKSKPATSKTKLKGALYLTLQEHKVTDIMQALKESKKTSKRQPRTEGSHKGTGSKLGVLDKSIVVSTTSRDEQDSEFSNDDEKYDKDGDADDECDDHVIDTKHDDDEDDKIEFDKDEIYKYKIHVRNEEDVEIKDAKVEESDKGEEKVIDATKEKAEKTLEVKDDAKKTKLPPSSSSLSMQMLVLLDIPIRHETPHTQSSSVQTIPVSVIPETTNLPSIQKIVTETSASTTIPSPQVTLILSTVQQTPTPIPTQPITTDALTVTTAIPESNTLSAVELRVANLEKDVSGLRTIKHSSKALVVLQSYVQTFVNSYLDTKVGDVTIKSTDKATLEEFDLKSALYQSMHANKSFNRIPANHRLYHALMEALIGDENTMDKGVTDIVKDHKRKHDDDEDDDDEDPPARPNQGKKTKKRKTKESKSSKNPSFTKETPKGKTLTKGSKTGNSTSVKEPIEEPIAETSKALNPKWFKQPPRPPTPDLEWNKLQPLPLQGPLGHRTIAADYFFNNDLEYLKTPDLELESIFNFTRYKHKIYTIGFIHYPIYTTTQDNRDRDLVLRRKKEKSLDYNNSFLGEYECSSLALVREEKRDEKKRVNHLKQDQTMLVIKRFSERKKRLAPHIGITLLTITSGLDSAFDLNDFLDGLVNYFWTGELNISDLGPVRNISLRVWMVLSLCPSVCEWELGDKIYGDIVPLLLRPIKYSELTEAQQLQDDSDVHATNIILHGLPPDVYALVNHQEAAKDIWDRSKFATDVKSAKSLYTTNYDQLYAHLSQHERHANKVRIMRKRYPDPLALVANSPTLYNPSQSPQQLDSSLDVPMFLQGEDPIECINKAMAFLSTVASRFPQSNNQLRTLSNPRNQATIQDGRVTVQQVKGRQTHSYTGIGNKGIATTLKRNYAAGQPRVVKCYNYQGKGHMRVRYWIRSNLHSYLTLSEAPVAQQTNSQNSAFQTEDLDTYDSDCNDLSSAKALKLKADIGIFVGYDPAKKEFRIYNKRTRMNIETIHVDFDELTPMAFEQFSSGSGPKLLTPGTISSRLVPNIPSTPYVPPTKNDWEILFQPMFDEYLNPPPFIPFNVEEADHDIEVAHMEINPSVEFLIPKPSFEESSTQKFSKGTIDPTLFFRREESIKKYSIETCESADTLMVEKSKLDEDPQMKAIDPIRYHGMIGTLIYLTASCQDTRKSTSGSMQLLGDRLLWYSIKKVQGIDSYEFLIANKKCVVNADVFRMILDICPRVKGVNFIDVPDDNTTHDFLIKLDLAYQIDHKKEERSRCKNMLFPRFTKVIINHILKKHKSLSNLKFQHYHTIKDDGIKQSNNLNPIRCSSCQWSDSPKKSRGKGSQRKKSADEYQETIDVSKEFEPEPELVKRKTYSKRRVKKKVTMSADDNIISDDPNTALELGKSISKTEAKEPEAARQVHHSHARIVTESVPEPTKRRKSGKVTSDPPTKLKGVPSLTPEEQKASDIMQALKESKKTSKRQVGHGGSSEGTGTIPGVPDEFTVVSATSKSEYSEEDKLDEEEKDDKEGDSDDEDDETEFDEDDIYKYKIRVHKDEDEEMLNDEVEDYDKGDEEVTDAAKADAKKSLEVKDDAKKTELPPTSSSLSISSGFVAQFLKLSSDFSLVSSVKDTTDAEINSLLEVKILSEVLHIHSPSMLSIPVSIISKTSVLTLVQESPSIATVTTQPSLSVSTTPFVPRQITTPIPIPPITIDALIITTAVSKSDALSAKQTPTIDLEQELEKTPLEILKIKKEQDEKKKMSKFTIKSTDKATLKEYDQKSALYQTMHANKSFNINPANHLLYHALMEALIEDENAMDKGVADTVQDHKRKYDDDEDDDDEDPPAGPNQGKKTNRRRTKESESSKKPSTTKKPLKVVMDDAGDDVVHDDY
nr:hypothetical protein [Tanacetum cinerariifolium]